MPKPNAKRIANRYLNKKGGSISKYFSKDELSSRNFVQAIGREMSSYTPRGLEVYGSAIRTSYDGRDAIRVQVKLSSVKRLPHDEDYDAWSKIELMTTTALEDMKRKIPRYYNYTIETYTIRNHINNIAEIYIFGK